MRPTAGLTLASVEKVERPPRGALPAKKRDAHRERQEKFFAFQDEGGSGKRPGNEGQPRTARKPHKRRPREACPDLYPAKKNRKTSTTTCLVGGGRRRRSPTPECSERRGDGGAGRGAARPRRRGGLRGAKPPGEKKSRAKRAPYPPAPLTAPRARKALCATLHSERKAPLYPALVPRYTRSNGRETCRGSPPRHRPGHPSEPAGARRPQPRPADRSGTSASVFRF